MTTIRLGPGTAYFAQDERSAAAVNRYLKCDTGSEAEALALAELRSTAAEIAPHVGAEAERTAFLDGKLRGLTAEATGFG